MKTDYLIKIGLHAVALLSLLFSSILNAQPQAPALTDTNYYLTEFRDEPFEEGSYYVARLILQKPLVECSPADQDLAGNWGSPANSLRLSVRFRRDEFLRGEPLHALVLLRNLETAPRSIFTSWRGSYNDFDYTIRHGTNTFTWTKPEEKRDILHSTDRNFDRPSAIGAHAQLATVVELNKLFDLTQIGDYALVVRLHATTNLVSGPAKFKIVETLSPSTQAATNAYFQLIREGVQRMLDSPKSETNSQGAPHSHGDQP